eukprot:TRINITY_DN8056_c3_g1_i2.p1 TRINITY_DN8056_c3_g1~~TRINITY_DN8056_c3_g1_i2.p1  ORF type:complete len:2237 (+),score=945.33 TRINITY_DN8056_c3_g1_i2:426-7136(+)
MKRFNSLEALVAELGGKRVIRKVLIANNGIAALKGIRSMRQWAFELLGDENAVQFVCMATPEDIKVNVEYIKMANETIEVPGGRNCNNYANVPLIVETAVACGCDAVWAGWGHASENPELPTTLKQKGITFLGPDAPAMAALGDKIASSIIAQTAQVPTIAWSGSGIVCPEGVMEVPQSLFEQACIKDAKHCVEVCRKLGFPLMIKASEGGGGKGIRMVRSEEEVVNAYHAVAGEVVRSPIFVMKLASDVRHLEVQLLADEYGTCIALRTRDCSVQRRHQKIIEEGPVVKTIPGSLENMEKAAIRLAELVGYRSVGTVEYLYHKPTGVFYFLELNPRLQVEHTVTELITGVNLPACMLCVGMGIPLSRIPDIRSYYNCDRFGSVPINFEKTAPLEPKVHTIACRITAENPDDGFAPTSGTIDELTFRNSKNAWGYFSISSHGGVHEFADSQFGHIFSTAPTREEAVAGMILSLKQLTIRGEIRTTKEYLIKLLDMPEFKDSDISTAWLDGLIKNRLRVEAPNPFLSVLCAATFKAVERFDTNRAKYLSFLEAGHVPSSDLFTTKMAFSLVLDAVKYEVNCTKKAPTEWLLTLNGSHISVGFRRLADRGLLLSLSDGKSPVVYAEEDASCLRVNIDGRTATFTNEVDPTKLRSPMPGKLVRYLVSEGDRVEPNQPFCEIEVMKMYLQLKTSIAGNISLKAQPGTTIHAGKVLAGIDPEDPENIVRAEENKKPWPPVALMWSAGSTPPPSPRQSAEPTQMSKAKSALETVYNLIMGYDLPKDVFEHSLQSTAEGIQAIGHSQVTLDGLPFPWLTKDLDRAELDKLDSKDNGRARVVHTITKLCEIFLSVETLYEGGKLPQEVVDGLRSERETESLAEVFDIQLAYAGQHRHRALAHLLTVSEGIAPQLRGVLQRIAGLGSYKASMIVFNARHLLRKIDLPCPDLRRQELEESLDAAKKNPQMLKSLVDKLKYGTDVISTFMMSDDNQHLEIALELLLRRVYAGVFDMTSFETKRLPTGQWFGHWTLATKSNQNPLKHDGITGSTSCEDLDEMLARTATDRSDEHMGAAEGIAGIFDNAEDVLKGLGDVIQQAPKSVDSICKVFVREKKHTHGKLSSEFTKVINEYKRMLQSSTITRVTFVVITNNKSPLYYTYRRSLDFAEDATYRHIAPSLAHMLELQKLKNYDIELYKGNPVNQVHVYIAREKEGMRPRPLKTRPRFFVRTLVLPSDINSPSADALSELTMYDAERVIASCINALEIATSDRSLDDTAANHIFIAFEGLKTEYTKIESVVNQISNVHASPLFRLGIVEVEIKLFCLLPGSEKPVLMRLFISNPTTHALCMESYIEIEDSQSPGRSVLVHVTPEGSIDEEDTPLSLKAKERMPSLTVPIGSLDFPTPIGRSLTGSSQMWEEGSTGTGDSLRSPTFYRMKVRTSASSESQQHGSKKALYWHHNSPLSPYPVLSNHQMRRLLALQNGTVYVYDWISLFEKCLWNSWEATILGRTDLAPHLEEAMPKEPLVAQELVWHSKTNSLQSILRNPGENRIGMVGWKWTIYSPTHYDKATQQVVPRKVYVVANDITVMSGSFSTAEDELFAAVSKAARLEGVPLVYLSANSGARIGLDPELKKLFKIKKGHDSNTLFEYLYLDDATKKKLEVDNKAMVCHTRERVDEETGEVHHVLDAIIGSQWGLGVENLSGSGLIAGEMAQCYDAIPTISIATGRTVGIGAYLVRLGRRVVQVKGSPIILTGNNALNKLLGKEVYTSNNQLGGTNIMAPNGVTHWVASHNYEAVRETMKWLNYLPDTSLSKKNKLPSPAVRRVAAVYDPVDRDVEVVTTPNVPYDVRMLIEGHASEEGWVPGLFDKGSFQEAQVDWAKTVVVGRATLGELPVGVIGVETRAVSKFNPADPADPSSVSAMTQQAGMVWYPDSARKTADFLADLNREGLPVIILANWRGFSGGMRDMYDEILKFGADIVQNLTHFKYPVTVYIPPNSELRGGAWVVIDPTINKKRIEMYADPTARGGVLEPSGIIEIKYREPEIYATMDRLDPECNRLSTQLKTAEGQLRSYLERMLHQRHESLYPVYKAVAIEFADLHDRPGRMLAVKSIDNVIAWKNARRFLYGRVKRRVLYTALEGALESSGVHADQQPVIIHQWFANYSKGCLVDGTPYQSRADLNENGNAVVLETATDEQVISFLEDIAGSEFENALSQVAYQAQVDRIMSALEGDERLKTAILARLQKE